MNMFKPVKATSQAEYFEQLPEDRKKQLLYLNNFIQEIAPKLTPNFLYNMPGYGSFDYKNYKKVTIKWPIVSVASQKNYISIYVCALEDNEYLAEKYKNELGLVSVGKSCIRFKKIEDLNFSKLAEIIKKAEANPGLIKN